MAVNKVVYGNNTLIDLTGDTVTADKLAQGYTAHDASGAAITGTMSPSGTDPTYKRWVVPITKQVVTAQTITLLTDSWIASHYNDSNLEISVTNTSQPSLTDASYVWFVRTTAKNISFVGDSSFYQFGDRSGKSNNYVIAINRSLSGATMATRGEIGATSSGDVKLRVDANCALGAGNYEITARLIYGEVVNNKWQI